VDPTKLTTSLEQADHLLRQGALQDAEALYREILDDTPGQPNASQGLGLIALHTGQASAAVELLQMASIGLPEDATIHTHLGLAFATARDARSAEGCYRKAIALANTRKRRSALRKGGAGIGPWSARRRNHGV
jgi:protein O-GlcNAc transferase